MPTLAHLSIRGHTYTWRRRLPVAVAAIAGRSHVARSLRTTDRRRARLAALKLDLAYEEAMTKLLMTWGATPPTKLEIDAILADLCRVLMDEVETWAATRTPFANAQTFADEDDFFANGGDIIEEQFYSPIGQQDHWEALLEIADYDEAKTRLKPILMARGYSVNEGDVAFKKLALQAMKTGIAVFRRASKDVLAAPTDDDVAELLGEATPPASLPAVVPPSPLPVAVQPAAPTAPAVNPDPTLAEAFDNFIADKIVADWSPKAKREAQTTKRLALDYFGADCRVGAITKKWAKSFRSDLAGIPKLQGKGRFAGLTMAEVIAAAEALNAAYDEFGVPEEDLEWPGLTGDGRVARLALKTVNKHLSYLYGLFEALVAEEETVKQNPFARLRYSKASIAKKVNEQRQAWSDVDIQALLATPIWQGCATEARPSWSGDKVYKNAGYWTPLLGMLAGLRLEEACQLAPADIEDIHGIPCIHIRPGEGKTLKTAAAIRQIPIHPLLIKAGLLDHAAAMRKAGHRQLFPELERGGQFQLLGYRVSRRFTDYRRQCGLYEPGKDFHSLRHSFNTHLFHRKIPAEMISVLMGHKLDGETAGRYFKGYEGEHLAEAISRIDYGIDDRILKPMGYVKTDNCSANAEQMHPDAL
jgi:integrase